MKRKTDCQDYEEPMRDFLVKVRKEAEIYLHVRAVTPEKAKDVAKDYVSHKEYQYFKRRKESPDNLFGLSGEIKVSSAWDFTPGNEKFLPEDKRFYDVPEGV